MALQSSGAISLANAQTEFGGSNPIAITEFYGMGTLPSSGIISLSDFYGQSSGYTFTTTISANTTNYNLKTAATAAGWNGTDPLNATITINTGVYVYSTSTGIYAFDTGSTFPVGSSLLLINKGNILGKGGKGGKGGNVVGAISAQNGAGGGAGGPGLIARYALSINNAGFIGGGGGGGGGAGGYTTS